MRLSLTNSDVPGTIAVVLPTVLPSRTQGMQRGAAAAAKRRAAAHCHLQAPWLVAIYIWSNDSHVTHLHMCVNRDQCICTMHIQRASLCVWMLW